MPNSPSGSRKVSKKPESAVIRVTALQLVLNSSMYLQVLGAKLMSNKSKVNIGYELRKFALSFGLAIDELEELKRSNQYPDRKIQKIGELVQKDKVFRKVFRDTLDLTYRNLKAAPKEKANG